MSLARNRSRLARSRPSRSAIGVVSIHSSTASESPRDSVTRQRLALACGSADEQRLVIHWMNPYDNCPNCGYDLDGHAFQQQAVAEAEAEDGPDPPPSRVVFYWWPKSLKACPQCGVPLPS